MINNTSFLKNDRFAALAGIELVKVEPGYALAKMNIEEKHLNGVNIVQGGATFTLADYAFAAASNAYGQVALGINASINYFQAPKGEVLFAEATELHASRRLANYNVDIYDENKELIARFTGTVYKKKDKVK
ncbi:MAG: PaaI family thioesterase [Syntrophaceticus sp.]|nr:PaaI family thioesterase [Syntrophaceticus sp.]